MFSSLETFSFCSVSLGVLAFNGRMVSACLWTYALAFTSLVSNQRSRNSPGMRHLVSAPMPRAVRSVMWREVSRS